VTSKNNDASSSSDRTRRVPLDFQRGARKDASVGIKMPKKKRDRLKAEEARARAKEDDNDDKDEKDGDDNNDDDDGRETKRSSSSSIKSPSKPPKTATPSSSPAPIIYPPAPSSTATNERKRSVKPSSPIVKPVKTDGNNTETKLLDDNDNKNNSSDDNDSDSDDTQRARGRRHKKGKGKNGNESNGDTGYDVPSNDDNDVEDEPLAQANVRFKGTRIPSSFLFLSLLNFVIDYLYHSTYRYTYRIV
jgi:hypothetical protein